MAEQAQAAAGWSYPENEQVLFLASVCYPDDAGAAVRATCRSLWWNEDFTRACSIAAHRSLLVSACRSVGTDARRLSFLLACSSDLQLNERHTQCTPIQHALICGNYSAVKQLAAHPGVDVGLPMPYGHTMLSYLCMTLGAGTLIETNEAAEDCALFLAGLKDAGGLHIFWPLHQTTSDRVSLLCKPLHVPGERMVVQDDPLAEGEEAAEMDPNAQQGTYLHHGRLNTLFFVAASGHVALARYWVREGLLRAWMFKPFCVVQRKHTFFFMDMERTM